MTNHMHHYGVNTFTEFTYPSGKTQMLKRDDVWSEHWALAPNFDYFTDTPSSCATSLGSISRVAF